MRRSSRSGERVGRCGAGDQSGSASLEFIVAGLVLLVPIVYLVVALGMIQGHSLGAEASARHVARAVATASGPDQARGRADRIVRAVADEYGMSPERVKLELSCRPTTTECPAAGGTLLVTVRTAVTLPLVPAVLGLERVAAIPIEATAVQKVSRFWGAP
ncbi:TadE family protein [Microbacterium hominis]|uniref:TadE family protein n=1 Tax=Microbacterium hominis TaxID=162426 RepID=A0A7D4U472_9MICO|nr:TadE family protein [Microbacterium hominis]QKJ19185.1 TadE family protein [Microbacterium hominis]